MDKAVSLTDGGIEQDLAGACFGPPWTTHVPPVLCLRFCYLHQLSTVL